MTDSNKRPAMELIESNHFVHIRLNEVWDEKTCKAIVEYISTEFVKSGKKDIYIDAGILGVESSIMDDHFAAYFAVYMGLFKARKMVVYISPEHREQALLFESICRKLGINIRFFFEPGNPSEWLAGMDDTTNSTRAKSKSAST
jgi:hypothetical protein